MRLFCTCFCVCSAKNTARCLVIVKTAFYIVGPTKNWVWSAVFIKKFLHAFVTEFRKTLFVFAFQKHFWKKLKFFNFFICFKLIFFGVFRSFWWADIKNNFLKIKIHYFNVFSSKNYFEKQPQSHNYQTLYTCFLLYINFNHNFYQIRI